MYDIEAPSGLSEKAPPLRELLAHAAHERLRACAVFASVLGLALVVAALIPARYRASATLAVLPAPEFTVRAEAGSRSINASALAMDQIMSAETEILGSADLHAGVLDTLGPENVFPAGSPGLVGDVLHRLAAPWTTEPSDPRAAQAERRLRRFDAALTVLPSRDANVITILFRHRDPDMAARVVNTLLSLYAARRSRLYEDPQLKIVQRETEAVARAVAEADAKLAAFKRAHDIFNDDSERDLLLRRRSEAAQAAADAGIAAAEQQARGGAGAGPGSAEPANVGLFREQDADTRSQSLNDSVQDLRAKLAAARDRYKDTSRLVTGLQAQIASRQADLAQLARKASVSVSREGRNPAFDSVRLDRLRAMAELQAARARQESEAGVEASLAESLRRLDADNAALGALLRQKASADENFRAASRLLEERRLVEAEDALRLANVRVIQGARVPQAPIAMKIYIIAAGFLLGCAGALAWMIGAYLARPVFFTAEGLAQATGLPTLSVFSREAAMGDG